MNVLRRLILAGLTLAGGFAPERWKPILYGVVFAVGRIDLPEGDPRLAKLAETTAELIEDVSTALQETDAKVLEALRLAAEVKATRALADLGFLPGVRP